MRSNKRGTNLIRIVKTEEGLKGAIHVINRDLFKIVASIIYTLYIFKQFLNKK